ncbi:MAG: hypothetical protein JSV20_01990 [Candidatus Bathyarchaeota archaeon]|nr:MAG: hypothetical protein JSV20_01990 [Candidatus Bathyarchaeota archaeon]
MDWERLFTQLGVTLILFGIALVVIPLLIKLLPIIDSEKVPWLLLYVYRRENFLFATSPILILIGIVYLLWILVRR